MVEKQKHQPKSAPGQKKTSEKKDIHGKKHEVLKAKKNCKVETRKELTKVNLDTLKNQVWHTVKAGENIWRIILNHAQESGKTPIKAEKLKNINITPGDKVYFTKNEVIIKYLSGGSKRVDFDMNIDCKPEEKKKEIKKSDTPKVPEKKSEEKKTEVTKTEIKDSTLNHKGKFEPSIDTLDITLGVMNVHQLEKEGKATKKSPEKKEEQKPSLTIFDKDSPLIWDQTAYKHEVEIKKVYWKKITSLIEKYCKWSIIDEDFLYWVIARESRFDKKATSYTWVKWLGQLTQDTIKTIVNIHEAKLKNNPNMAELYITDQVTKSDKKNKKWHYPIDDKASQEPLNQIKLTISYLMYLEEMFSDVKDKNFKTELIITSYNLGPGKTKEIFDTYRGVKNREWLKQAIERAQKRWEVSVAKAKEVTVYTKIVKENIQKSKSIKLASL